MRAPTFWLPLLVALAMACDGPQPPQPPRPRPPPPPAPRPAGATLDALAAGLARKLGPTAYCLAATELLGPRHGGRERSVFGKHCLRRFAGLLGEKAPHLRIDPVEDCPKHSPQWFENLSLQKADAIIEGTYRLNEAESTFMLTIEVSRRAGHLLASAHGRIRAEATDIEDARRPLPILKTASQTMKEIEEKLTLEELKVDLYRLEGTAHDIKVAIRPARTPVSVGDRIEFNVQSSVNGYLYVLYHGTSGALDFLVPHTDFPRFEVQAGRTHLVPPRGPVAERPNPVTGAKDLVYFKLNAVAPAGWERVKAIVSRQPIAWPVNAAGRVPTDTLARLQAVRAILRDARFGEGRCELQVQNLPTPR